MTTTPYRKKLIEVAIPLEAINAASAREKSIRHGHPSTLHLWWARRPLAACRAVLFAQLVDDPSSLPDEFPTPELQDAERKRLFKIIEDLVKWENSTNEEVLDRARAEIRRSCGGVMPPVYDPFSGGGSIPLEAQRLGLPAYGSDLNPVAVMIGKAMIEIPPKFKNMEPIHPGLKERNHYRNAEGLAEDVKHYGEWMRERAQERIGDLYPKVELPKANGGGKATVVAWIWARTVPSPDPAFSDADVPLISSFLLSSKKGQEAWIEPVIDKPSKTIDFRIRLGGTKEEIEIARAGTKLGRGSNFKCLLTDTAITAEYVRKQGKTSGFGQRLIAVVANSSKGRVFLSPQRPQEDVAFSREPKNKPSQKQARNPRWFSPPEYGMETFGDLFTSRQLILLETYSDLVREVRERIFLDFRSGDASEDAKPLRDGGKGAKAYSEAVSLYLAMGVSRLADIQNAFCMWESSKTQVRHLFTRHAIPMLWDFAEAGAFSGSAGDFGVSLNSIVKAIARFIPNSEGIEIQHDAQTVKYPPGTVISCDPPYYDNIGYADVSDFFFCWLKPPLQDVYPEIFGVLATPKSEELVATPYRHGGKSGAEDFFLNGMRNAVANMAQQTGSNFPATIYYAFKQSEIAKEGISSTGWATFLQAVVEAGYAVVGTWPMRTEMANRMIASGTNALANSVVLVCRKKEVTAETITRAEFIRALKRELPPAIAELQAANVSPADMPQSAIGPGMGVFSRYAGVLESDDSPMSVKTALQLINKELDEFLNQVQGEFDADTRFAITWYEQNGMDKGDYGTADNLARARGIAVESVKHAGIIESAAGQVRILKRDELDKDWSPETDKHLTVWEMLQYLVRLHEVSGLSDDAAALLKRYGAQADAVKDLAYCLYDIAANKRREAGEATAYNALIADWTELTRMAASVSLEDANRQLRFEV
ncbi:MAG: DUF1156 domain-containing protein [Pseudomonadota bacterium]